MTFEAVTTIIPITLKTMLLTPFRLLSLSIASLATLGWQHSSYPALIWAQLNIKNQIELSAYSQFQIDQNDISMGSALALAALERPRHIIRYDATYKKIKFPHGDVSPDTGCAADVIVRSLRSLGVDLQELIYLDMLSSFASYAKNKPDAKPDTNIDHRKVPNLQVFFARHGSSLPVTRKYDEYKPGDIITCRTNENQPHIAIVVPSPTGGARPWIVHNIGWGPCIEDRLFDFNLTGHYRYPAD